MKKDEIANILNNFEWEQIKYYLIIEKLDNHLSSIHIGETNNKVFAKPIQFTKETYNGFPIEIITDDSCKLKIEINFDAILMLKCLKWFKKLDDYNGITITNIYNRVIIYDFGYKGHYNADKCRTYSGLTIRHNWSTSGSWLMPNKDNTKGIELNVNVKDDKYRFIINDYRLTTILEHYIDTKRRIDESK